MPRKVDNKLDRDYRDKINDCLNHILKLSLNIENNTSKRHVYDSRFIDIQDKSEVLLMAEYYNMKSELLNTTLNFKEYLEQYPSLYEMVTDVVKDVDVDKEIAEAFNSRSLQLGGFGSPASFRTTNRE